MMEKTDLNITPDPHKGRHVLEQHNQEWMRRAGQMAGFLYLAGDIAFINHARTFKNGRMDTLLMTRSVAYLVGSMILLCCADGKDDSPRSRARREKRKQQLGAQMHDAGISDESQETMMQWVRNELEEHPWEMAYLLFVAGSSMQGISAVSQKRYTEAAATLGTITSMLIPMAVPEGDQKPFIKFSKNMEEQGHHFAQSYHHIKQALPLLKPVFDINDVALHQIRHHPLRFGAAVAMVSNTMYGLEALKKQPVEKGLVAMSATYLGANIITSFASKKMAEADDIEVYAEALNEHMAGDASLAPPKVQGLQ